MDRDIVLAVALGFTFGGVAATMAVLLLLNDPIRGTCGVILVGVAVTCATLMAFDRA